MNPVQETDTNRPHPLDVLESMADSEGWNFNRENRDDMATSVAGEHANYPTSFTWMPESEVLHFSCGFELKPAANRVDEVRRLILKINEVLWVGHMDYWNHTDMVLFRHGMPLPKGLMFTEEQFTVILHEGLEVCEQYYAAFQLVLWKGLSADQAFESAALAPPEGTQTS